MGGRGEGRGGEGSATGWVFSLGRLEVLISLLDAHIYDVHSYFYSSESADAPPVVVKINHLVRAFLAESSDC